MTTMKSRVLRRWVLGTTDGGSGLRIRVSLTAAVSSRLRSRLPEWVRENGPPPRVLKTLPSKLHPTPFTNPGFGDRTVLRARTPARVSVSCSESRSRARTKPTSHKDQMLVSSCCHIS